MVCILCDSKTKTSNSRYMKKNGNTWRRRTCPRCHAVFTTRETIAMDVSYRVTKSDGTIKPFYREHLLMSVLDATKHLTGYLETSIALTDTICGTLLASKRLQLSTDDIITQSALVLKRFDHSAYLRYITLHQH